MRGMKVKRKRDRKRERERRGAKAKIEPGVMKDDESWGRVRHGVCQGQDRV